MYSFLAFLNISDYNVTWLSENQVVPMPGILFVTEKLLVFSGTLGNDIVLPFRHISTISKELTMGLLSKTIRLSDSEEKQVIDNYVC